MEHVLGSMSFLKCGSNSKLYVYTEGETKVVIKCVAISAGKECGHLRNEFEMLNRLEHPNIIEAYSFKKNVRLNSTAHTSELDSIRDGLDNQGKVSVSNTTSTQYQSSTHPQPEPELINNSPTIHLEQEQLSNILVLEHAPYGSLLDYHNHVKMNITELRYLFTNACEAVLYLHRNYIVHRDIKFDNLLCCDDENGDIIVKLADFGFATSVLSESKSIVMFNTFKGTRRGYMAPEIHAVLGQREKMYDARKSDVFALGVVLFGMVMGKLPFERATREDRFYRWLAEGEEERFWQEHGREVNKVVGEEGAMIEDFKDLFMRMVKEEPKERLDMEEVMDHEWLKGKIQRRKGLKDDSSK